MMADLDNWRSADKPTDAERKSRSQDLGGYQRACCGFHFDPFVDSNSRVSGSLLLYLFDPGTKPSFNFSLELCLIVLLLQNLDGFSISISRYEVTGHFLGPVFRTDKTKQMTLIARVSAIWVTIVNAGQRILKGRFIMPWRTNRPSVASLLDEVQLIFKDCENIALIRCHGGKPPFHSVLLTRLVSVRQPLTVAIPAACQRKVYATKYFAGDHELSSPAVRNIAQ